MTSLAIMGLHRAGTAPQIAGEIWLDGEELVGLSAERVRRLRGKKMAMIFQDPLSSMHPFYTVGQQIIEAYRIHNDVTQAGGPQARHRDARPGRHPAAEVRVDDYPHQFSGGMRQRAMIAMALSCDPELLIADEPTTALDVTVQAQILDLIRDLQREFNSAVIIITHDLGVVAELADDILVMYAGRAVEYGSADEIFNEPAAPLHLGAAGLDAAAGPRADRAAGADQGHPAEPDQRAARLPVPPALRLRRAQRRRQRDRASGAAATSAVATTSPATCPREDRLRIWDSRDQAEAVKAERP